MVNLEIKVATLQTSLTAYILGLAAVRGLQGLNELHDWG